MSIFPTKTLLATDGSKEAELATATAADLAKSTTSELEVIYVLNAEPWRFPPDESGRYDWLEMMEAQKHWEGTSSDVGDGPEGKSRAELMSLCAR